MSDRGCATPRRPASGRRSTRCPPTAAATRRSSPSCRAGPASTSSPRPGSTTSGSTARPLEPALDRGRAGRPVRGRHRGGHRRARLRRPGRPPDRRSGPASSRSPAARAARRPATCRSSGRPPRPTHGPACPILTHCEAGTGALEQVRVLADAGVPAERISLSHVDKVVDRGYHRELLATGAFAEYDQAFRWGDAPNGTLELLEAAAADGLVGQVVLGMDAARQGYYTAYGGSPGLTYLLAAFSDAARGARPRTRRSGIGLFVDNPARAFAFAEVDR